MSKEFYRATINLCMDVFGCTIQQGAVVEVEGNRVSCGALEGELDKSKSFRCFLRNGFLKQITEEEAEKARPAAVPEKKPEEEKKKMAVVNGDENKIKMDVKPWRDMTDQEIVEADNNGGKVVGGMKVKECQTVEIARKIEPSKTSVKTGAESVEGEARNKKKEEKPVDKDEIARRKEARIKKAAEAEAAAKKAEAVVKKAADKAEETAEAKPKKMTVKAADDAAAPEKVIKIETKTEK
ncbi:MAG: hypothetical protein J6Y62_00915 [Clostridia bacterium]|nr:hypothetical protein [Clostridia bacterium]